MATNQGIDFLKAFEKRSAPAKRLSRFFTIGFFFFIITYFLLVAGTFSLWLFSKNEQQKISQQIEMKKKQINQLKKRESLYFILKQRLSTLAKFKSLKEEKDFPQILSFLLGLNNEGVFFTEIKISEDGKVEISGKTPNFLALSRFLEKLSGEEYSKFFNQIVLTSLNRQEDGGYNFSLSLNYGKT